MIERMKGRIEHIFDIVLPTRLVFFAIGTATSVPISDMSNSCSSDGVAPRGKLNQQRARRFLAAKEQLDFDEFTNEDDEEDDEEEQETKEDKESKKEEDEQKDTKQMEEDDSEVAFFDPNCITPGSFFFFFILHNV